MFSSLPALHCMPCDALTLPRVSSGTGPHVARLDCGACGRFLKWAPKVFVDPLQKEQRLMNALNRVLLLGTIGKYGVEVRYAPSGSACASFTLVVTDQGYDGQFYSTLLSCEVWGKKAEAASECEAGQLVLFEGKVSRRKKANGEYDLVIAGFELTPILAPTPALSGHTN